MPRYIDADKAIAEINKSDLLVGNNAEWAKEILNRIPTADVVEVVRCKDCKYLYCLSAIDRRFYCRHCPKGLTGINIVEDNPFCSYGERKE